YNLPRQELPETYWQIGYIDVVRPRVILNQDRMHGRKIIPLFLPQGHIEIDNEEDFAAAEAALLSGTEGRGGDGSGAQPRYPS
ncbi:MAG: hypothetical protein ACRD1T_08670, partial [Acidimicrobiia bacterium]